MTLAKKRPGECKFLEVIGLVLAPFTNVVKYCESVNPVIQGNGTFKLAMLNREMNRLVLKFYKEKSVLTFVHNHSKHCIIKALD